MCISNSVALGVHQSPNMSCAETEGQCILLRQGQSQCSLSSLHNYYVPFHSHKCSAWLVNHNSLPKHRAQHIRHLGKVSSLPWQVNNICWEIATQAVHFVHLRNLFLTVEVEIRTFSSMKVFFSNVIMLIQIHIGTIIGLTSAGFGFSWANEERGLWFFMHKSVKSSSLILSLT